MSEAVKIGLFEADIIARGSRFYLDENLLFHEDPFSPQLKTHKLTGKLKDFWSFSIDYQYRIIFEFADKDIIWFHSIGTHAIYD